MTKVFFSSGAMEVRLVFMVVVGGNFPMGREANLPDPQGVSALHSPWEQLSLFALFEQLVLVDAADYEQADALISLRKSLDVVKILNASYLHRESNRQRGALGFSFPQKSGKLLGGGGRLSEVAVSEVP